MAYSMAYMERLGMEADVYQQSILKIYLWVDLVAFVGAQSAERTC